MENTLGYREDCKFLVRDSNGCRCGAGKLILVSCDRQCDCYVLRNDNNSLSNSPVEVLERIDKDKTKYEHDKNIRGLLGFTNFTGFLLTRVIKDLKGVSLEQFKESTGDRKSVV